jgi:hypothetical protein
MSSDTESMPRGSGGIALDRGSSHHPKVIELIGLPVDCTCVKAKAAGSPPAAATPPHPRVGVEGSDVAGGALESGQVGTRNASPPRGWPACAGVADASVRFLATAAVVLLTEGRPCLETARASPVRSGLADFRDHSARSSMAWVRLVAGIGLHYHDLRRVPGYY